MWVHNFFFKLLLFATSGFTKIMLRRKLQFLTQKNGKQENGTMHVQPIWNSSLSPTIKAFPYSMYFAIKNISYFERFTLKARFSLA